MPSVNGRFQATSSFPTLFWTRHEEWREVHQALVTLFQRYGPTLAAVLTAATQARERLEALFPLFDDFTTQVCPSCRASCCGEAIVAFDFKDLIWLHALDLPIPPHQLRGHDRERCRYLGERGCQLDRLRRPFVCTWYYCPAMYKLFHEMPPRRQRRCSALMSQAQQLRREMEAEFIRVVSAGPNPEKSRCRSVQSLRP